MVFRSLPFFILFLPFSIAAGEHFRFDYEYYPSIDGWLKFHLIPASWQEAWLRCNLEGSVLASPSDVKMKLAMDAHCKAKCTTKRGFYIGVHATFSKGDFFSIEGISLAKMPVRWAAGEPNRADNNEDCIVLNNGTIADVNCSNFYPYMCFRKRTEDMDITSCGTVDKAYELNSLTGNCYKFHRAGKTWPRAYMTCAAEGGYLAVINSHDEALILKKIYDKYFSKIRPDTYSNALLVGIHDWGDHGVWRTIHGLEVEDAGYADWYPGQPANTSGQYCGWMLDNLKLINSWCESPAPFICEKSPDSLLD